MPSIFHILSRGAVIAAVALVTHGAQAQINRKAYHLGTDFGLNPSMSYARVSDMGTLDAVKAKYPAAYAHIQAIKPGAAGDAWMMELSAFDIMWMQANWSGLGGGQVIGSTTAYLVSYNPVTIPEGYYMATIIPELSMGDYAGAGCGWNQPNGTAHNTIIGIWHEEWNGDPAERHGFSSSTWGKLGGSYYAEGFSIRDIRVDGRHLASGSTFKGTGFRFWQMGTGSTAERLRSDENRTAGFDFFNATPGCVGSLTAMHNVEAGALSSGGWGSTLTIACIEVDDNAVGIEQREAFGYAPGGTLKAFIKGETGLKSASVTATRGLMAAILRGQFNADLQVQMTAKGIVVDALVLVDPIVGTTQPQVSTLRLMGKCNVESGQGYRTLIQQAHNTLTGGGGYWNPTQDKRSFDVTYRTRNGGEVEEGSVKLAKQASTCTGRRGFLPQGGVFDPASCLPAFAYIIGTTTTPPPTPTPVACTFTYSAWSTCTNDRQTRTATSAPVGCTGTPPSDSLSRACSVVPPPSSTSAIDPNDVVILVNSSDPTSAAMGAAYASSWGIPVANMVTVNLGATDNLSTDALLNTARTAIAAKGKQYTVLAFGKPSRFSSQSITSAITFGKRTVSDLTVSPLYGYTGTRPATDLGVRPSMLLISDRYIRKDAHGTKPAGKSYQILAKDASGSPRGNARAGQTTPNVVLFDNRTLSNVGTGENACNNLGDDCWIAARKPTGAVTAYYGSMYKLCCDAGVTWRKGYYGDHVTSFGGFLPGDATGLNSNGQTALTWHLDRGAAASCGTVSEPWQGSGGNLAVQFVNASVFHPLYTGGQPMGIACWAAIKSPDRTLIAGDLLCAPYK